MPLSFVSWNCRGGLLFNRKQKFIRDLVSTHKLAFIGLLESKRELVDDFLVRKLWPNLDFMFDWIPSVGASGGLLLIWNSVSLSNVAISKGSRWIAMDFLFQGVSCRHILVYASNLAPERLLLWQELESLLSFNGTILISGDFNETIHPEDRLNGVGYTLSMLAFSDFVNNSELMDLPLHGRLFTWQNSLSKSRIDRCLISATAGTIWPFMSLTALPGNHSDHVPLCFRSMNIIDCGPKPFRSIDAWWDHTDFAKFVEVSWLSVCEKHTNLTLRLKELRHCIKIWNQTIFGDQNKRIKELTTEIFSKEAAADHHAISEEERMEIGNLKSELWNAEKRADSIWLQKSRVNWSNAGDRNTNFFHSVASKHYRNNHISSIQVEESVFEEPADIRFHIRDFYKSLYGQQDQIDFDLSGLLFDKISDVQAQGLIMPFSEVEIFKALSSCGERKAPVPDGFNFYFYRRAWVFMKGVFLEFFADFHSSHSLPSGINTSFMVLVPKVAGSSSIKDYRPISLVNGCFKLLSKTLSLRLAPLLTKVVSDSQHAFLKGRSILECSMIANELVHLASRRKDKLLVLKLDFHKAFDSIDWRHLMSVMKSMNFPAKWIEWMFACLSSATTAILVNGSPVEPINLKRGVRQGDPISPYLFVIAVEGLKRILDKSGELGFTSGYCFADDQNPISLLQFADDTLLYLPFDIEQLQNLTRILRCYEIVSGLTINFHKSSIMGINVSNDDLFLAAEMVGCRIDSLPVKYLGLPLTGRKLVTGTWDHVIERFKSRLALWKGSLLSPAGRLVLIKSVLFSILVYFMSLHSMPNTIFKKMESYMIRFLWKGDVSNRVLSKVSWKTICQDYDKGGLGITNLHIRNQSLLFKWVWKLRCGNDNSLWFKVISTCSLVINWECLLNGDAKKLSYIWKGIRKSCCLDNFAWDIFIANIRFDVGRGNSISLWNDNWMDNGPASFLFPRLYNLSNQKRAFIDEIWTRGWRWRRRLRGSEALLFQPLQIIFGRLNSTLTTDDVVLWNSNSGLFSPNSFCRFVNRAILLDRNHNNTGLNINVEANDIRPAAVNVSSRTAAAHRFFAGGGTGLASEAVLSGMDITARRFGHFHETVAAIQSSRPPIEELNTDAPHLFASRYQLAAEIIVEDNGNSVNRDVATHVQNSTIPFMVVWKSTAPPRVKFFIWLALHNRVPSLDFLVRRTIITMDNSLCSLCNVVETQAHILIHCDFARSIWNGILQKIDLTWIFPGTFEDFMIQWESIVHRGPYRKLWQTLWFLVIWELWKCRNARVFSNSVTNKDTMIFNCFMKAVFFFKGCNRDFSYSGLYFFRNPYAILFSDS
ncbi:uncharacterized protein LOC126661702 [Mercurialis annua]|uniref:uncharacterized protein LOC126661702 n=1 Tax=Mercurialis annua TaxID=3986 RepID=UPI00215F4620|nr:uncharacterized protein LOC126661702 [Mercurialis annua]